MSIRYSTVLQPLDTPTLVASSVLLCNSWQQRLLSTGHIPMHLHRALCTARHSQSLRFRKSSTAGDKLLSLAERTGVQPIASQLPQPPIHSPSIMTTSRQQQQQQRQRWWQWRQQDRQHYHHRNQQQCQDHQYCQHRGQRHIHPTAVIEPGACLGDNVSIGPFCVVGKHAVLGDGVRLDSHVRVDGHTNLGAGSIVQAFATLGALPQDLKYAGEPSHLVIGKRCRIFEYALLSGGTAAGGGITSLGDDCFIMSHCHVGHDCMLGHNVILASSAALAGHVHVGDHARISGYACIQQRVNVGSGAFLGGGSVLAHDLIPYGLAVGNRAELLSINVRGLRRQNVGGVEIRTLLSAYRYLFQLPADGYYRPLPLPPMPTIHERAECMHGAQSVRKHARIRQVAAFVLGERAVATEGAPVGSIGQSLTKRPLCYPPNTV